jgi:3D (Asp-Asp-Asp) domain-containing protein
LETKLEAENEVSVVKVIKRIEKVETAIPFKTKVVRDTSMSISENSIQTQGVEGIDCETYEVLLYDGEEVERTFISKERTREPVDEVRLMGTKGGEKEKGENFSYSKVLTCNATAYDLSFQSCGKNPGHPAYGITATGTRARYGTVAVDPKVIPLGTRMYIETEDGSFVYGYCIAEDTGGAIKGNKVDLFFDSNSDCMQFGRRNVKVYILD